jgi:GTP1/Obg family GTP-binding protein
MNQQDRDRYEEAVAWCIEYGASVRFLSGFIHSMPCVRIKVGGYPNVERPSFLEAIQTAQVMVAEREKEL